MFGFVKKLFFVAMTFFSYNLLNVDPLKCVSIINLEWKIRPQLININSDNPLFYLFSIEKNKCNGSCNNINDPYAKLCIPDIVNPIQDGHFGECPLSKICHTYPPLTKRGTVIP